MSLNCGIVGLPNVGKSTIFSAMTSAPAEVANYPFCTISPNVGIVNIEDKRLLKIAKITNPKRTVPTSVEFLDIAGLVKGASKGEGLGNQFLGHIRQVDTIIHIVRCFEDPNVVHVNGEVDPVNDIETINLELALADLETVEKRLSSIEKLLRSHDKKISNHAKISRPILEKLQTSLSEGKLASSLGLSPEDQDVVSDIHLITFKKVITVCNVDESYFVNGNRHVKDVENFLSQNHQDHQVLTICGKLESEIATLESTEEKKEFLSNMGIAESGLDQLILAAYSSLRLKTFFTVGPKEVRAWTFLEGTTASKAAGIIHSDFERGFIKAEVYHCEDLFNYGTENIIKEKGKLRIEGKDYLVKDGDIIFFRFNV